MPPIKLLCTCPACKNTNEVIVDRAAYDAYVGGDARHIQDIFPELTPTQRELIQTGMCQDCWDRVMKPEEEDSE